MAVDESALSDVLDALQRGEAMDVVRELARIAMQDLIETEFTARIGAGRYERSEERVTHRNGSRPRLLSTKAGDMELRIPKMREGTFFPTLLEPRRRIDQALWAVVMEAFVTGTSTRKVDDLVQALGVESGISKSEVSRICRHLDVQVNAFMTRELSHIEFPYVFLDATYVNARDTARHQVVSRAVVIATGVTATGEREVLGLAVGDSEDEIFWTEFLRSLRARGLGGVRLVISDAHAGLTKAVRKVLSGAAWQRCRVHFARNLLARVPKGQQDMVAAAFRTIFVHTDTDDLNATWDQVADTLAAKFPKVAELMHAAKTDVLAFSAFPVEHWRKIWSTNPLERVNKEIKRRANVVGIFPNDAAVVRLVGAVLLETHEDWQIGDRRYFSEQSMAKLYPERDNDLALNPANNG
ncbi:MAG TPA: IS256 family transposase [Acidimicrobiales bacterium]|nr:IS256 family transposase [Acidimicrobiales bacterium]